MKKNIPTLFKSIGYVTIGTILGKISGFLKHYLVVYSFGLTEYADAFFVANIIPEMLVNILISGLLAGAFIPVASEVLAIEGKKRFSDFISSLFIFVGILSLIFSMLLFFIPDLIAKVLAPGYTVNQLKIVSNLLRYFSPGIIFLGLAAILAGILQSLEDFRIVSFGLLIYNVTFIGSLLIFSPRYHVLSAGLGISLGAFFWFGSHFLFTYRMMKWKPAFSAVVAYLKKTAKLAVPSLLIITISNMVLLVEKNFASRFVAGTISELNLAFRLSHLFLIVLILPLSTVLLPRMTKYFSQKQYDKIKATIQSVMQIITAILILFFIFFVYNAHFVTKMTYFFLHVDSKNLLLISEYALWYAVSFIGLFYYMFLLRVFYSMQQIWEIVKANLIGMAFYLIFLSILIPKLEVYAFPIAYSIYAIVTTIYLALYLNFKLFPRSNILGQNKIFYVASIFYVLIAINVKIFWGAKNGVLEDILFSLIFLSFYIYFLLRKKVFNW
ncbi:virulence factor MVIN family protein [Caldithrix abyssi DSM 13497]|uniref:Murein biosynthesis integral membrane protein MurJ n=1 Tax=Caldithrix abyssi DSM 13497 TaxID=880073 RepID=H1XS89_CALAY|nr:lipid II flippase MurJ [Caldithrix abyssi]APF20195.1 murein biosynthesis integral membrane protein MurJ [Caldithrix abyssi DSM 13497]EHO40253.1 virulence factor MVIN family protein [Caldithrix abyssi DSM 13497]